MRLVQRRRAARARRGRDAAQHADPPPLFAGRRACRERVGWVLPQPRLDRRRFPLELGRWSRWCLLYHNLAITADGSVWNWGVGLFGRLGHGDQQAQLLPKKVAAFTGRRAVAVSAGTHHSLALTADGSAWSFGCGWNGGLGHGDTQTQLLPKKVEAFAGQRVVAVSAGAHHSLALTADGAVFTWGKGERGCLGHGEDVSDQLLPKKVAAWAPGQ